MLRRIDLEAQREAMGYRWLRWSTSTIGHRLTGTRHGEAAERMADSLFRASGFTDVAFFPFKATAWQRGTIDVSVTDSMGIPRSLRSVALALTPASSDVEGLVVDAGNGLAADMDRLGAELHGRIVLMNLQLIAAPAGSSNLHRSEKCALAIAHGAVGVVFVNNVDGGVLLTGTASVTNEPIPIPAVCISGEEGARIRGQLAGAARLRAHITMRNTIAPVTARNIIATLPGTTHPEEVIVVGGHLDSWDLATGATDNGIGSHSILDLARCLNAVGDRPARTIKFVLFMGEEQGLLGSTALVEAWKKTGELGRVRCMINLDMSGHPSGFNVFGPGDWGTLVKDAENAMHALDTSFKAGFNGDPGLHSDHQPFMLAGVPTIAPLCDLGEHVYRCYHSDCDDIQLVDPQAMVDNVRRIGQLLWVLAGSKELPGRFGDTELRDRLRAAGLEEQLRLQKEWRW